MMSRVKTGCTLWFRSPVAVQLESGQRRRSRSSSPPIALNPLTIQTAFSFRQPHSVSVFSQGLNLSGVGLLSY